jgi:pimeloyl-ACP methyl ester carboxylesterase
MLCPKGVRVQFPPRAPNPLCLAILIGVNVIVDQLLVNYRLTGKGRLILMLHGWGDSAKGLQGLEKSLIDNYQVLNIDLPGFGGSQAPNEPWNLDNYSFFLESLINKLELPQPYGVIGHSNGASIALRAVSLGKLEPKKLVLLAAAGLREGNGLRRFLLMLLAKIGNLATVWLPERYRRSLRSSLYNAAGSDMLVAPELQETFKRTVRQDVKSDAENIKLPTLLIYARNDQATPLENGELYHSLIKDSRLEVIDDAGHFVHLDQPEKVANIVKEFLK